MGEILTAYILGSILAYLIPVILLYNIHRNTKRTKDYIAAIFDKMKRDLEKEKANG